MERTNNIFSPLFTYCIYAPGRAQRNKKNEMEQIILYCIPSEGCIAYIWGVYLVQREVKYKIRLMCIIERYLFMRTHRKHAYFWVCAHACIYLNCIGGGDSQWRRRMTSAAAVAMAHKYFLFALASESLLIITHILYTDNNIYVSLSTNIYMVHWVRCFIWVNKIYRGIKTVEVFLLLLFYEYINCRYIKRKKKHKFYGHV